MTQSNKHLQNGQRDSEADTRKTKVLKGRLTLELPEQAVRRLDELKQTVEASSYAEVIRRALRAYEVLVLEAEGGKRIEIVEPDGRRTPVKLLP